MFGFVKTHLVPRANRPGTARLLIAVAALCGSAGLRSAHADNTVLDWNNEFLLITQQTSGNLVAGPPDVAQEIAAMGEAMSDAVNASTGNTISSFAYTGGAVANANANVAAATAAYTALYNVFTDPVWQTPITSTSIPALTTNPNLAANNSSNVTLANNIIIPELQSFFASQLTSMGLTSPGTTCASSSSALCNGYNLGISAATAVDNATATSPTASGAVAAIENGLNANAPVGSGTTPGVYVPPSNLLRPEMFPTWGSTVTPTGITSTQFNSALATISGPPALGSQAYATALLQTECQGSSSGFSGLPTNIQSACTAAGFAQTAAQAQASATAALFWNDPGTTIQPPGHWLQITDSALISQGSSLLQSAQLTALEGEAMNDAGIAAWDVKYQDNLWRPVTAISDCGPGGTSAGTVTWNANFTTCDTSWTSLIATPPHPDYIAGHPAFSGAAATVLADFFGTDNISFTSSSDYYCNSGSNMFNSSNQVIGCAVTVGSTTTNYYICSATSSPEFNNSDLPVDCKDNATNAITSLDGAQCNTVTTNGVNNNSPLICPITLSFDSFSSASSGTNGAEFSRVVGGIHTPPAVVDALTVGDAVGAEVAADAGLPDVVPEPSSLSVCALGLLALTRLRRRRVRPA